MRLLAAADRTVQSWKNGGGRTSEVAVFPPSAGMNNFEWRVSMASVPVPGRFSHFEEVDRVLAVIEGELELTFEGEPEPVRLERTSTPHAFPGEAAVVGTPVSGEVTDLNVMTRRGRWSGTIKRLASPGTTEIVANGEHVFFLFMGEGRLQPSDTDPVPMRRFDAIRIDGPMDRSVTIKTEYDVYLLVVGASPNDARPNAT